MVNLRQGLRVQIPGVWSYFFSKVQDIFKTTALTTFINLTSIKQHVSKNIQLVIREESNFLFFWKSVDDHFGYSHGAVAVKTNIQTALRCADGMPCQPLHKHAIQTFDNTTLWGGQCEKAQIRAGKKKSKPGFNCCKINHNTTQTSQEVQRC